MPFDIDPNYRQVPERLADLKAVHPNARLRPLDPANPYRIEVIDGKTFIVYTAACYRDEEDELPAVAVAWEPFPGRTPYTRDSELMNAETSAWGRAIVAALRSESKSIASAEDVRNRQADQAASGPPTQTPRVTTGWATDAESKIAHAALKVRISHLTAAQREALSNPGWPMNKENFDTVEAQVKQAESS